MSIDHEHLLKLQYEQHVWEHSETLPLPSKFLGYFHYTLYTFTLYLYLTLSFDDYPYSNMGSHTVFGIRAIYR